MGEGEVISEYSNEHLCFLIRYVNKAQNKAIGTDAGGYQQRQVLGCDGVQTV